MLKYKVVDKSNGTEREIRISVSAVQEGALVEADELSESGERLAEGSVILSPMEAAQFVSSARRSECTACGVLGTRSGHASDTMRLSKILYDGILGVKHGVADSNLEIGAVRTVVPAFAVNAMALCIERMMEALLFPTCGDRAEAW